jgi:hypothetical protein
MRIIKYFENFAKNKWEVILGNPDKEIQGKRLINLVDTAYKNTPLGSFVKTIKDVVKSNWFVIDYNEEDGVDACVFYREPRSNENWVGKKIQGIGHDGAKESKKLVIGKVIDILKKDGFWIEASDKMEEVLESNGCNRVSDLSTLQKLYPNSKIKILDGGRYQRSLESGEIVTESVFGLPKFK